MKFKDEFISCEHLLMAVAEVAFFGSGNARAFRREEGSLGKNADSASRLGPRDGRNAGEQIPGLGKIRRE